MHTTVSKRSNFYSKDSANNLDFVKSCGREINTEKDSKYEHVDNIANGHSNKQSTTSELYVGYSNIPNQVYRKAVRKAFEFNIMVVGETGLGKSTFVNSLLLAEFYNSEYLGPSLRSNKTIKVCSSTVLVKENGVSLRLTITDTPGFGDLIDNSDCWKPLIDYLNNRFDEFMTAESRVTRVSSNILDNRIHACLYFLAPTGHHLKPLDIECMRLLQDKVNLIPIIGKADCLTPEECKEFKKNILADLEQHKIKFYIFPECGTKIGSNEIEESAQLLRMRERMPFAVVGANTTVKDNNGARIRARSYPWGTVEVDNVEHNDFAVLRHFLITVQMQDLRESTHRIHYENYRHAKLSGIATESHFQTIDGKDPMMLMESERREHEVKMRKMKADMEAVFEQKVAEKNQKLKEFEADLLHRADQMREQLRAQEGELEAGRRAFEADKASWEEAWREWDIGGDIHASGLSLGLGERVLSEVIKERSKTEKKRKGLF